MSDVILRGIDVEAILIPALREYLRPQNVQVLRTAPDTLPSKLVTIRRTGGPSLNMVMDQAHLDIIVYGGANPSALTALALDVQAFLSAFTGQGVRRVTVSGPSDVGGPTPRRFMYADAIIRRSPV